MEIKDFEALNQYSKLGIEHIKRISENKNYHFHVS